MAKKEVILISGIDGFLGYNLFRELSDKYDIIGLEKTLEFKRFKKADSNNTPVYTNDNFHELYQINRIDYIIHTATHHAKNYDSIDEVFMTNILLGCKLLELVKAKNIHLFINIDTILPAQTNLYSFTKSQFRETAKYLANKEKLNVLGLKLDMMYGPNAGSHNFIQYMSEKISSQHKEIPLTKGIQKRSFIYIKDLVHTIKLTIENKHHLMTNNYSEYLVINPKLITIKEVMNLLKRILQKSTELKFNAIPYREDEIMEPPTDNKIWESIGWTPKYSMEESLKELFNQSNKQ